MNTERNPDYFYANDGTVIKDLEDLFVSLQTMDDETFRHHVNEEKNDFATWIKDIFKEEFLAKSIELTKDKDIILKKIFNRLFS